MLGGSVAVSLLLLAGSAFAQGLSKDEQKCIDAYNNSLRLVSAQAGKSARACVKNGAKGAETNVNNCVVSNTDGKIAGKTTKVTGLYGSKCTGTEPIQQGAATGNAAHVDGITDFMNELFGDPIAQPPVDKADGKCLDKAVQRSTQAITEIIKAHRSCKKNAMKAGSVTSSATLDAECGNFAQIDAGGKALAKLNKANSDTAAACGAATSTLPTLFPGLEAGCTSTAAALGLCVVRESRCAACLILNEADGQSMDCDLFDDAVANGSCGFVPLNIGAHSCTLDTAPLLCVGGPFNGLACTNSSDCIPGGFCATAASKLDLRLAAAAFELPAAGTLDITCGTTSPSGKATCSCDVTSFDPIVLPGIGLVCVNAIGGCPPGEIDCDGGNSLSVDTHADHNIGSCGSNAACATSCDSFCNTLGATYVVMDSGCEAFCRGGSNDEDPCTADSDCPGGSCPGKDPVTHPNVCSCTCGGSGLGAASVPGGLSCNLGVQIDVLVGPGDCDSPPSIILSPMCGPISTEVATSRIFDQGNTLGSNIPAPAALTQTGAAIDCTSLAASSTSGLTLVGGLGFFDSTLGDLLSGQVLVCQ